MARTPEGRRLTEAHKRAQIKLGAMAAALSADNAKRLDPENLDGTVERFEIVDASLEAVRALI